MTTQNASTTNEMHHESPTPRGIHSLARYQPALRELGAVICHALIWPLAIVAISWELRDGFDTSSLSGAISHGGLVLLPVVLVAVILWQSLRRGGLVEKFFRWESDLVRGLNSAISAILFFVLPVLYFSVVLRTFRDGRWADSLGRLLFVVAIGLLAMGLGWAARDFRRWARGKAERGVRLVPGACFWATAGGVVAAVAITVMSLAGYDYGAEQMGWRLLTSVLLASMVGVFTGFASHLMLVAQFKIKLRRLTAEREGNEVDEGSIDISEISAQVNQLLSVTAFVAIVVIGWAIWGKVFPANTYLDQIRLWKGPLIDGSFEWVTLRSVLTALGAIMLTWVLSRNLPGLLEITLLDRLPLDRGGRYAIGFVCRYVVGIIGIIFACQLLGFSWRSLQWLAAGLSVGLGFGLQEVFANLVSGIIILIERPIRVGDHVTVNGVSGTVTRMQLRATTIQDWDSRELIVPNKKFITEDVINWTLTEAHSRAVFSVGVAYGSDTALVEKKLLQVARANRNVVQTPEPSVVFSRFDDSSLNFDLRVYLPHRDLFPKVQHEINMQIDEVFRAEGIEIAFPQRDLHIRTGAFRLAGSAESTRNDEAQSAKPSGKKSMPSPHFPRMPSGQPIESPMTQNG